jgi:hypothetical protein
MAMRLLRSRTIKIVALTAAVTLAVPAALHATNTTNTGTPTKTRVVRGDTAVATIDGSQPATWFNVVGVTGSISVEANTTAFLLARVQGVQGCKGGPPCMVRLLVDGVEMLPRHFSLTAFASGPVLNLERSTMPLDPGTHTVRLQATSSDLSFCKAAPPPCAYSLSSWHLTIERIKV